MTRGRLRAPWRFTKMGGPASTPRRHLIPTPVSIARKTSQHVDQEHSLEVRMGRKCKAHKPSRAFDLVVEIAAHDPTIPDVVRRDLLGCRQRQGMLALNHEALVAV